MGTEFTPLTSTAGGLMTGTAALLLMLIYGRIMGATGVLNGVFTSRLPGDRAWRLAVIGGMICGPLVYLVVSGGFPVVDVPVSRLHLLIGGVIVGMGVTYGSGCTSGHGVCGIARLSPRSIVATLTFMAGAGITVFVLRHVIGGTG